MNASALFFFRVRALARRKSFERRARPAPEVEVDGVHVPVVFSLLSRSRPPLGGRLRTLLSAVYPKGRPTEVDCLVGSRTTST